MKHPLCDGAHPTRMPKVGPFPEDRSQCWLCWQALNEPTRARALIERRPAAVEAAKPAAPKPKARWPRKIRLLSWLRHRKDAGAGDTFERRTRWVGGMQWKWAYRWLTGKECPCGSKQARMNTEYPYSPGKGWRLPV